MTDSKIDYALWFELLLAYCVAVTLMAVLMAIIPTLEHYKLTSAIARGEFVRQGGIEYARYLKSSSIEIAFSAFGAAWLLFFCAGLLQFFTMVLPFAYLKSGGLQMDSVRAWWFYSLMGAIISAAPFAAINAINFDSNRSFLSQFWFTTFIASCGASAGLALKFRLVRLARKQISYANLVNLAKHTEAN